MLGVALGCMGLSYDDFCRMDFAEFSAVWEAYATERDAAYKDRWQRMRLLASITIQPHLDRRHRLTPERLLPFPWDKKTERPQAPALTAQQQRDRMKKLVERLGDTLI